MAFRKRDGRERTDGLDGRYGRHAIEPGAAFPLLRADLGELPGLFLDCAFGGQPCTGVTRDLGLWLRCGFGSAAPSAVYSRSYIFSSGHSVPSSVSLEDCKRIIALAKEAGSYE
jgi:hypothetical protein